VSGQDGRAPVPLPIETEHAEKLVRNVFAAEYAKTDYKSKRALAAKLYKQSSTEADVTARYVLLREARDLSTETKDRATAFLAIDRLAKLYRVRVVDALGMKEKVLVAEQTGKLKPYAAELLFESWLGLVDEAAKIEEYDAAKQLLKNLDKLARRVGLRNEVKLWHEKLETLASRRATIKPHLVKLLDAPDDPDANEQVAMFFLLDKGDFDAAVPLLTKTNESPVRTAALLEVGKPLDAAARAAVGDAWWEAAQSTKHAALRARLLERAVHWYRLTTEGLTGLAKTQVDRRLAEIRKSQPIVRRRARLSELRFTTEGGARLKSIESMSPARKKGGVLQVKNPRNLNGFVLTAESYKGDFSAYVEVYGGVNIGLIVSGEYSVTTITVPLRSRGWSKVMIERRGDRLTFKLNGRKVTPKGTRSSKPTMPGRVGIRIGRRQSCLLRKFEVGEDVYKPQ
jgi:hypothetical protein